VRESYHQLLHAMKCVISHPTDKPEHRAAKTFKAIDPSMEKFYKSLATCVSGKRALELLGFSEKRFSMSPEDLEWRFEADYPCEMLIIRAPA
jgi:hypothetical protein